MKGKNEKIKNNKNTVMKIIRKVNNMEIIIFS